LLLVLSVEEAAFAVLPGNLVIKLIWQLACSIASFLIMLLCSCHPVYPYLKTSHYELLVLPQAAFESLVQSHFSTTLYSQQLQPLRDSAHLVLLCSTFDAAAYTSQNVTARSFAADVASTAGWLSQLADGCSHSVSIATANSSSATGFDTGMSCSSGVGHGGDSKQCVSQYGASNSSSGGNSSSSNGLQASKAGLVVMEVGAVRAAMLKMAGAALG
jgi:hypothetical protein